MPLPIIERDDLHRALLDAFRGAAAEDLQDVRRATAVLDDAAVRVVVSEAARARLTTLRAASLPPHNPESCHDDCAHPDLDHAAVGQPCEAAKGVPLTLPPADDGTPDVRHAHAWLTDACAQLATLAHEHNDDRLMNLRATLSDIATRCDITPKAGGGERRGRFCQRCARS